MNNIVLRNVLILLGSSFIFDFMFSQIRKTNPKLEELLESIPSKYKENFLIKWAFLIVIIVIMTLAMLILNLNNIVGTVIIGFSISLAELVFEKPGKTSKSKK